MSLKFIVIGVDALFGVIINLHVVFPLCIIMDTREVPIQTLLDISIVVIVPNALKYDLSKTSTALLLHYHYTYQ